METIQSVLLSVRQGDWMVFIDLKEAYLQVPIHPDSRKYLRFVAFGKPYQFRALCFGLSTAPQVFTRVMALISSILHSLGIRIRRYLDDWLVQANTREAVLQALETVLSICCELGIVVNPAKPNFVPAQRVLYLGTVLNAQTFRASPSQERIDKLLSFGDEFVLQATARVHLAVSSGDSFVSLPSHSGGSLLHASSSANFPSLVGSPGRLLPHLLIGHVSPGSALVARS